jgi:hypothetical protein
MNSIFQLANTFPGFVLALAVRAFALGFLCAAGLWLFRARNSAVQYAVWRLSLFAMLAMPLALVVAPAIRFPRLPAIQVARKLKGALLLLIRNRKNNSSVSQSEILRWLNPIDLPLLQCRGR